jgi:hypothetical protein
MEIVNCAGENWIPSGGTALFFHATDEEQARDYREPDKPVYQVRRYTELLGETMDEVSISDGMDVMRLVSDDGVVYEFYHQQDCCEHVEIIDVIGDLDDLVGQPIYMAEEVTYKDHDPDDVVNLEESWQESWTWTFYKFATVKGYVTVRWHGSSNGYYSEDVWMRSYRLVCLQ